MLIGTEKTRSMSRYSDAQQGLMKRKKPARAVCADETMIADTRGDLSSTQMIDRKLEAILDSGNRWAAREEQRIQALVDTTV